MGRRSPRLAFAAVIDPEPDRRARHTVRTGDDDEDDDEYGGGGADDNEEDEKEEESEHARAHELE